MKEIIKYKNMLDIDLPSINSDINGDINNSINIGIDVDGTLTKEVIGRDILGLSYHEAEKAMLNCTPQNGIDILIDDALLGNNCNKYIITGRIERYRYVTIEWFDMYGIPYKDLTMFPNDFYDKNGYSVPKYAEYKLYLHLQKKIHASLDDNIQVVETLNRSGIPCYLVENDFKDAFEKVLKLRDNIRNKDNNEKKIENKK